MTWDQSSYEQQDLCFLLFQVGVVPSTLKTSTFPWVLIKIVSLRSFIKGKNPV